MRLKASSRPWNPGFQASLHQLRSSTLQDASETWPRLPLRGAAARPDGGSDSNGLRSSSCVSEGRQAARPEPQAISSLRAGTVGNAVKRGENVLQLRSLVFFKAMFA